MFPKDQDIRRLLIEIDVAIARMNSEKSDIEDITISENKKKAFSLIKDFPLNIDGSISDATIGKFLDVNNKVSLFLYKQSMLHHLDIMLYDIACLSKKKESILKKFFELKEKQIIYELKRDLTDTDLIDRDEVLCMKIFLVNILSSKKGILSKEEREKLLGLSFIRGFETNFQKLFTIKVSKEDIGYKKNMLELNFNALNYQMLLLNNNDTKSVVLDKKLLENMVLGFHSIAKFDPDFKTYIKDFKIDILNSGINPIKITWITEEKSNRVVCELLVTKIKEFLSDVCVETNVNDIYEFMFLKGEELATGIREIKLKDKLIDIEIKNGKEINLRKPKKI